MNIKKEEAKILLLLLFYFTITVFHFHLNDIMNSSDDDIT
ncbi:hypothetical protein OXPF_40030 [Oxobacter pfennigii]|uniref:Uncharacterized protein n=1 Tax=Oxobacter pfennigii TaxID=36849 RepID=A0A0P8Y706_9CLOT|nr:hypothetical protein OXPF_40030 [Oxobacter pfennigii]